ncbi:MAG: TIM barrel protein [Evtepia gabavorous]
MRKRGHGGGGHCPGHWAGRCSGGIALSLHAPYFVNPANPEPDSQAKTAGYVLAACRVARWMGADRVVVHTGAIQKRTRQAALATARECFRTLRRRCDEEGYQDILCARRPWERSISWGTWKRF